VCGIFVLHGQMVEISRNQIRETRDWTSESVLSVATSNNARAGILMFLATPPTVGGSAWTNALSAQKNDWTLYTNDGLQRAKPIYEPGLPGLRIQENLVRVAIGLALGAFGYGPFSIVNNHLSSGGPVSMSNTQVTATADLATAGKESVGFKDPLLVEILNLGLAIEDVNQGNGFVAQYAETDNADLGVARNLANASSGAVLFTNNRCQLEAWAAGVRGLCSVAIFSFDHILFTSNHLWLDGPTLTTVLDAFVFGLSVQMCDNRLQEGQRYPVLASGASLGIANVTAHNLATYCLFVGAAANYRINSPNVILVRDLCPLPAATAGATAAATNQ
jgi:hypothetical protein